MLKHQNSAIGAQTRRARPFSRLGLPAALFLVGWALASCANLGPAGFSEPTLRVGVSPDYPPVIFERDGEIVGIEADFAHRLGRDLHRPIEFVEIPFPDLLDALEAGEIDVVMSGLSNTPDRASRVQFNRALYGNRPAGFDSKSGHRALRPNSGNSASRHPRRLPTRHDRRALCGVFTDSRRELRLRQCRRRLA